jgi:hypothetical protein
MTDEKTEVEKRPKLKRDWHGRHVRLLREIESEGGRIFDAGTVMKVTRNFGGLHLIAVAACKDCTLRFRHQVQGIPEADVELLPADYTPAEKRVRSVPTYMVTRACGCSMPVFNLPYEKALKLSETPCQTHYEEWALRSEE